MRSQFLENDGDRLTFSNLSEFQSVLASLDRSVPARDRGRKSFHRERYCALYYLEALVQSGITFPLSITKSESPDFTISSSEGTAIGIEHSDISTPEWQQALTELQRRLRKTGGMVHDSGPGYPEEEAHHEWAKLALSAIEKKITKLNEPHFKKLSSYELLLYSNTNLPNVTEEKAIQRLTEAFNARFHSVAFERLFSTVSIIYGRDIWFRRLHLRNAS